MSSARLAARLQRRVEARFTTPVTILRQALTPNGRGEDTLGAPAPAGTFNGLLEDLRNHAEPVLIGEQLQDRVPFALYYPLAVGMAPDPGAPSAAYLLRTDTLRIGTHTYEIRSLADPATDAPGHKAILWRNI